MKVDLLGAKCSPSAASMDHAVVPLVGLPAASVQSNAAPPHSWTSIPRCSLYQARSATGSFALKKIPPIPVTLFIEPPQCVFRLRHSGPNGRVLPSGRRVRRVWACCHAADGLLGSFRC